MNDARNERLERISPMLTKLRQKDMPEDVAGLVETLCQEIKDNDPLSEKVADRLAVFWRRFPELRSQGLKFLKAQQAKVKGSALILIDGLLAFCGDTAAEAGLNERLKRGAPDRLDALSLERLLTSVSWQQKEELLKPIKALKKRLEGGRISRGAVGVAQGVNEFLNAHKKANKSQIQLIRDLLATFDDSEEKLDEFYLDTGVRDLEQLRKGEADRLSMWLQALVNKHFPKRITNKQISFIRSLIKKLPLAANAEATIAEEVAGVTHLAKLDRDQASGVIEFLLQLKKQNGL